MKYFRILQITLLLASMLMLSGHSYASQDEKNEKIFSKKIVAHESFSRSQPEIAENNLDTLPQNNTLMRTLSHFEELPDDVLYTILRFLEIRTLGHLGSVSCHLNQATGANPVWIFHLMRDKIIPLLGKSWDNYPTYIVSYKSYYAVLHLLQSMSKNSDELINKHLKLAFSLDFVLSQYCFGLFFNMLGEKEKANKSFQKAGELGDSLSQKIIVDAISKDH